jgi:hypothetical protein
LPTLDQQATISSVMLACVLLFSAIQTERQRCIWRLSTAMWTQFQNSYVSSFFLLLLPSLLLPWRTNRQTSECPSINLLHNSRKPLNISSINVKGATKFVTRSVVIKNSKLAQHCFHWRLVVLCPRALFAKDFAGNSVLHVSHTKAPSCTALIKEEMKRFSDQEV